MIGGLGYHFLRQGRRDELDMPVSARLPQDLGIMPFARSAHLEP